VEASLTIGTLSTALATDTAVDPATQMTCPSCHTARPGVTADTWDAGQWRCERCGEHWTRSRLATVAEYAAWEREYAATGLVRPRAALADHA
jgi:hypothetical protein